MRDYLTFAATEIYLGHWDGYAMSANNYAVYHNPTDDMWTLIPWGLDQLFEHESPFGGLMEGPGPVWLRGGRIHQLCFRSDTCRSQLARAVADLLDRVVEMDLQGLAEEAIALVAGHTLIEASAYGDPNRTAESMNRVLFQIANRADEMADWLPCLEGGTVDNDNDTYNGCDEDCDDYNPERHPGALEACNFEDDDCNGTPDDPEDCPKCKQEPGPGDTELTLCIETLSWEDAEQHCQGTGQHLVSVHEEEEWHFITWYMMDNFNIFDSWIGLSRQTDAEEFTWVDGTPLNVDYWAEGPPDPEGGGCVISSPEGWRIAPCDEPHAFVCQSR
jgi:hypothetical protein